EAVLERRDHPEVATAAADRPEQVGVFVCAGGAQPTVGGNDIYGKQVVAREAVCSAEPTDAAAKGEPGDAGHRYDAARCGQTEGLRLTVEFGPCHAGLRAGCLTRRVHPD